MLPDCSCASNVPSDISVEPVIGAVLAVYADFEKSVAVTLPLALH